MGSLYHAAKAETSGGKFEFELFSRNLCVVSSTGGLGNVGNTSYQISVFQNKKSLKRILRKCLENVTKDREIESMSKNTASSSKPSLTRAVNAKFSVFEPDNWREQEKLSFQRIYLELCFVFVIQ